MNTLDGNQPVNPEPSRLRRDASASYWRGIGTLAGTGLAGYGLYRFHPLLRTMPENIAGTFGPSFGMLGAGFWEAGRSAAGYARHMGLGRHASGIPKYRWIDMAMSYAKYIEEISPGQMFRTFGLYEHLFAYGTRRGVDVTFTGAQALDMMEYLRRLTGEALSETELATQGLRLRGGKLMMGERVILEHAHLMMRKYVPAGATGQVEAARHFGRTAAVYEEMLGGGRRLQRPVRMGLETAEEAISSFTIGGGRTRWQAIKRYGSATTRMWTQRFFRLMDDPFLGMFEFMGLFDREAVEATRLSKWAERARFKNIFGLGGRYEGTTAEMFGRWLLPGRPGIGRRLPRPGLLLAAIGLPLAYHGISELMAEYGEGTIAEAGIPGLAAEITERFQMGRAAIGEATGLQRFVRAQEEAAPGTTRVITALGLPLAGGLTGAFLGYGTRLAATMTGDPVTALATARRAGPLPGLLRRLPGPFRKQFGRTGRWGMIGLAIGAALGAPMLPGVIARLLGGGETREELEELYAGRREVPVRRGRWWIFGRTPLAGRGVEYFKPHWSVIARTRARQEALFTGEENWMFRALKQTPLLQDVFDPYYFERLHYEDRPYPITGPSDLGLGPLDPIYKATIGQVLKPTRYMHRAEFTEDGEPIRYEDRPPLAPVPELGGLEPYGPREPYGMTELGRQTLEYYSEAIGLIGWMGRLATKAGFGDVTPYDVHPRMVSANEIASIKRSYWDLSLGDPFGTTEAYRRLNPRKNRGQYWNPIRNTMPEWLPGEEYFINFMIGDPFTKIPRGEYRLPGPGYAAIHPELKGIEPENYPEYNRFKILADVAPYSAEYKYYSSRMTKLNNEGALTKKQFAQVKIARAQVREIKKRKQFYEYKTEEEMRDLNLPQQMAAAYWETVSRLETPVEQIIFPPIAPMAKFVHQRTALEDYEQAQIYGTDQSFWQKIWANFMRPGFYRTAHMLGYEGVPPHIERQRDIEEYFDKLEYLKNMRLEGQAREKGDYKLANEYRTKRRETMTGMNPYGNPLWILRALPKRERDYWRAFTGETDPEKQKRILELVPEEIAEAYRGFWLRRAAGQMGKALKSGKLTEKDAIEAEKLIKFVEEDMRRQGQPMSPTLLREFAATVEAGRAKPHQYADWYRIKETEEFFLSHQLPGPKWIGWDPRVDLEDIKMKFVREEGLDFHDYNLWEDRLYAMTRKPYLDEATEELDMDDHWERPEEVQTRLRRLLGEYQADGISVIPVMNGGRIEMDIEDNQGLRLNQLISQSRF